MRFSLLVRMAWEKEMNNKQHTTTAGEDYLESVLMDIYARVKYNKPEELFEVVNDALNQENFDEKSPISMVKE